MPPRVKKLIGLAALLPYLGAYMLGAIVLADALPRHWAAQLVYFMIAGVAWVLPLRPILRWMEAPPPLSRDDGRSD
ncbi:MAG: DUF2842 domain-containing protein [Pseudomonadota bacterium]